MKKESREMDMEMGKMRESVEMITTMMGMQVEGAGSVGNTLNINLGFTVDVAVYHEVSSAMLGIFLHGTSSRPNPGQESSKHIDGLSEVFTKT
jgi:hypothetical protein